MISDLFKEDVKNEEKLFLSLCSMEDKQKLMQQIPMTYHDYLRITCITYNMNLAYYEVKINELFPEFYKLKKDMLKRHNDILKEYPDYYKDEDVDKKVQIWLNEFCSQISNKHQQKKYARMFELEL